MQKEKIKKIVYISLAAAIFFSAGAAFSFRANVAEAAKPTKWQTMLEQSGIPQSFWQKCLPKVKRGEYNRVKKLWAASGGATTSSATVQPSSLGPEIAVGLWYFRTGDVFSIDANRTYNIRRSDGGEVIAQVEKDSSTKVKYDNDGKLKVYNSISGAIVDDEVWFDAADGDNSSIIFDVHHDQKWDGYKQKWDGYKHFRGKINVNYYKGKDIYNNKKNKKVSQVWVINKLPLEQYVWGAGETTGTGGSDHARVMVTIFRTYGQWYIDNATKYKPLGFKIRSDAGSQIYVGEDREDKYPKVKDAAEDTQGKIITYKGETILAPYCSNTDGYTRPYPYTDRDKKPSKDYPYLESVKDHKEGTINGLKPGQNGNHMWGMSAKGALGYAEDGKSWEWIIKYYYSNVDISSQY